MRSDRTSIIKTASTRPDWRAFTAQDNFSSPVEYCDLTKVDPSNLPQTEIIVGSLPCQGFSLNGYKDQEDPRNNLVWTFLDIVETINPKIWVFENVMGFKRLYGGHFYEIFSSRINKMDYYLNDFEIDAVNYGVPQNRKRFFAMESKYKMPMGPSITHSHPGNLSGLQSYVTLWEVISDLPTPSLGDRKSVYDYTILPQNDYQGWPRAGSNRMHNHTTRAHSDRVLGKIARIQCEEGMSKLVGSYYENRVHYCGGCRQALKNQPS